MKIAILTTSFPRWPGDYMGIFVFEAARALQRRGHQVKVIAIHSPGSKTRETWDGMEIIRTQYLPEKWELLQSQGGGLPEVWKSRPWARLQVLPFMLAHFINILVSTRGWDMLHANWTLSGSMAWAVHLLTGKPYVVTVQGSDIFKAPRLPLVAGITRTVLRGAKKVLALSESLSGAVVALGVDPEMVEVVPNGVNTQRFLPALSADRADQVLFVGSLIERKGVRYLLEAFASLHQCRLSTRLVLVGEGSQRDEYEEKARVLGIASNVLFTGSQTQEQVSAWMQSSRLFVLPSIEEGLGVVLLEALACGTPIVATRVGGIPDVVVADVGRLVPPADPEQLKAAMLSILDLPEQDWSVLSQNARARAVNVFDWDRIAGRIENLYKA